MFLKVQILNLFKWTYLSHTSKDRSTQKKIDLWSDILILYDLFMNKLFSEINKLQLSQKDISIV